MTGRREPFGELWHVSRYSDVRHGFRPQCDCFRTDDPPTLHVVVELAGVEPSAVQVEATERALVVSGRRERPQPTGARWHQVEIEYGAFDRRIELAEEVVADAVSTEYKSGILRIALPLARSR